MTETEVAAAPVASPAKAATPKKAKAPKVKGEKKPVKLATHPPVADMVLAAITTLKERNGSSLQAIKKYIGANYKCDVVKLSVFIRKAVVKGVEKGTFSQRKGTGATGSFKLAVKGVAPKNAAKKIDTGEKKTAAVKKPAKKPAHEENAKAAAAKTAMKAGAVKKVKAATPKKQKATKPSKIAAKNPKTTKPKKATPAKKVAAKM